MIYIKGQILSIVPKSYTNKKGEEIHNVELDIKEDDERYFQTVSCSQDAGSHFSKGDEVELPVREFSTITKNNTIFNRFVLQENMVDLT